ncbi:TIGR03087 family PEP-CTERM/XrtA system glycosyltransferase [Sphingosinicella sp. BN140058]|uniref:TIGR03087 family PEP-CTERM/XrtA system glycosyltransferase n=1 Tax=Sphingosinicella sp. BN140058 TaxID=1892855 RepID=UPI001011F581|nr:TIGR03087 family PEP-CTERM/XrtA system glycosyltransferase [Sphingosinicella sp. BN140058]QAY79163.1 TIGR03087 family PEP-CTERM/XrtA system glycosyltransferase [Sphingosinicella sp. BN140058]
MSEILFLAHRIPYPPDRGDKIRSWNILKALAGLGTVHLAAFADDEADAAHLPALGAALGGRLGEAHVEIRRTGRAAAALRALASGKPVSLTLFDSRELRSFVDRISRERPISTCFAFSGQMAQFVPKGARLVMDFVDMDSAKFQAYAGAGGLLAPIHQREAEKLFAFERATAARAAVSLFVSDAEAALFKARAALADADIRALHNGVDLDFYDPHARFERGSRSEAPLLVFTGQMDYAPNVDAVRWFAQAVLPAVPTARFAIVGRNPSDAVRRLASHPRILVTGAVPDVRTWLAAADVVVAPLRIARGIQNKVLEAMAMARPVVASPAAFEGIEATPGRDLLVADTADAQAKTIRHLLCDPVRAATIGAAARRRMEEAYRWEVRLAPLANIVGIPRRVQAA